MEYCEQGTDKNEMYSLKALSLCQQQMPEIVKIIDSQIDPEMLNKLGLKMKLSNIYTKITKTEWINFWNARLLMMLWRAS